MRILPQRELGQIDERGRLHGTNGTGTSFISSETTEAIMGFGKGALLWLIGIPLPIILLLAIFMNR